MSRRLIEDTLPCFIAMGAPRVRTDTCRAWLKQGAGDDASIAIRQHPRQERALEANAFGHGAETLACTDPSGRDAPDTKPEGIQPRPRQRLSLDGGTPDEGTCLPAAGRNTRRRQAQVLYG